MAGAGRILSTHVGSLVRPPELLAVIEKLYRDEPAPELDDALERAVGDVVREQHACGIDIVSDGEFGKLHSWSQYVIDRLEGFERRPLPPGTPLRAIRGRDYAAFPEFYDEYEAAHGVAGLGGSIRPAQTVVTGPLRYRPESIAADTARLTRAAAANGVTGAFLPVVAPASVAPNRVDEFYATDEEFLFALAAELNKEYRAIVDAGLFLQVDDAYMATQFDVMDDFDAYRRWAELRVDALNRALDGIPRDRTRYHLCWGSWNGPHVHDVELHRIVDLVLRVDVGAYAIEMANPRHEHEWRVWEDVTLPEGTSLIPGVVSHCTNVVEHPDLVAERIVRLAHLVGRDRVMAGTDCGFAQGPFGRRVHPTIMWAKLRTLADGAARASRLLWR